MNQDFLYDVFLSHNRADEPRVRRLAERLRAAGLGSDWVGLERSTVGRGNLPFRAPANAAHRFRSRPQGLKRVSITPIARGPAAR